MKHPFSNKNLLRINLRYKNILIPFMKQAPGTSQSSYYNVSQIVCHRLWTIIHP